MMYTSFHGTGSKTYPDKVIRERYFKDYNFKGVYLDVGSAGPIEMSNSCHFRHNGWRILSVEANPYFCKQHRDLGYEIVECAVGSTSAQNVDFSILKSEFPMESASSLGGAEKNWAKDWADYGAVNIIVQAQKQIIKVNVMTLNEIMEKFNITRIDILDLDIERSELDALKGFDLNKYRPTLCIIEDHNSAASGIEQYMKSNQYFLDYRIEYDNYYLRESEV